MRWSTETCQTRYRNVTCPRGPIISTCRKSPDTRIVNSTWHDLGMVTAFSIHTI